MEQWQYEVTAGGWLWYCIDDKATTADSPMLRSGTPKRPSDVEGKCIFCWEVGALSPEHPLSNPVLDRAGFLCRIGRPRRLVRGQFAGEARLARRVNGSLGAEVNGPVHVRH